MTPQRDDHQAHSKLAHERHVAHLEAAINEATAALGWLKAWPNKITNAEEELESVINVLRVALRRARPDDETDGTTPSTFDRNKPAHTYSFDEQGDVR